MVIALVFVFVVGVADVVGRIRENQVDRRLGQRTHHFDAIARKDGIQRQRRRLLGRLGRHLCLVPGPVSGPRLIWPQDDSTAIRRQILF